MNKNRVLKRVFLHHKKATKKADETHMLIRLERMAEWTDSGLHDSLTFTNCSKSIINAIIPYKMMAI